MKIKQLVIKLAVANIIAIGGLSVASIYSINANTEAVNQDIKRNALFNSMNEKVSVADNGLRKQLADYGYTLLRGVDPEMFEKYSKEYNNDIEEVKTAMKNLDSSITEISNNSGGVEKSNLNELSLQIAEFNKAYEKMNAEYTKALATFDTADLETPKKVDMLVRNYEKSSVEALSKLNKLIRKHSTDSNNAIAEETNNRTSTQEMLLLGLMVAFMGILGSLLFLTGKALLKSIGADPEELIEYFKELSNGNYSATISLDKKEKNSVSYNARVMQLKLVNTLNGFKEATNEVNKINDVNIGDQAGEIINALRENKANTRALTAILNQFNTKGE